MHPYSHEKQEFNNFMTKLVEKIIKTNIEIQEDYNKLSPNAKIMADNARQYILRSVTQIQNINDLINILNNLKR